MPEKTSVSSYTLQQKIAAWSVHAFTISGVVWACLAMLSMAYGRYIEMWGWLALSLIVDALDGTLARRYKVSQVVPWFDGVALDLIVDYLTWTFIPAIFMYRVIDLGPKPVAMIMMIIVCSSSMFCYCNKAMKSHDNYFVGFPAAWNIVILYLYLLQFPAWGSITTILVMTVLTVLPITFVHPFRVAHLQIPNILATVVWLLCVAYLTYFYPSAPMIVEIAWWASGIWFIGVGIWRTFRQKTTHH
ncbi:MAG: CDP-alcohol phosphatidyltransferase family protein [Actinomycetaceae bacterium]|nr:CDP-alcohol phosphatidyltransferase family protein [Actinomycetaceae bacterium]